MNAYVYTANEYVFEDSKGNSTIDKELTVDTSNNLSYVHITNDTKQRFMENQVVKICYTDETEIHNDYTNNAIDNETAYRIINIS